MTTNAALLDAITEKDFMQSVIDEARLRGWRVYHIFDARRSEAGFPDAVMLRPPRLLMVEFKTMKGKVTPAQQEWLRELATVPAPVETYLIRPSDIGWFSGVLA